MFKFNKSFNTNVTDKFINTDCISIGNFNEKLLGAET
jgi:hypothetical protein